jgi:DNA (cytosine-5)-methyltransferase 1
MSGPQNVAEALSTIMVGSVPVAEKANTLFWQLTTPLITEALSGQHTGALFGNSLSSGDFQTIIKFSATIAIWQSPSTVPAHIKTLAGVTHNDVRTLTADVLRRDGIAVDVITGGFPCQDVSVAGKQRGMGEGTRSGLWSEIVRLIGELRPRYVIVENVAALLAGPSEKRGGWFGRVLGDLAECGYDAEWENIPASAVGASHRRERVWILAHPAQVQRNGSKDHAGIGMGAGPLSKLGNGGWADFMANANEIGRSEMWLPEPDVGRVVDGVPDRVDRLAALGNAIVPQIAELIGRAILAAEKAQS